MRRRIDVLAYALLLVTACATFDREVAKDEYTLDLKGCVKFAKTRDEALVCIKSVNDKWNEAGAPAAALDGGDAQ